MDRSARKPFVGGNWKMNLDHAGCSALAAALAENFSDGDRVDVAVFPGFPYLHKVWGILKDTGSAIRLGAQNFYHEPDGAFTGEVSLNQLRDVGVSVALVGHSERRHVIGESLTLINEKVLAGVEAGFEVVLCVGEIARQRESGTTDQVNAEQTLSALAGVSNRKMGQVTIAYEPVWAIGTGRTATAADAQRAQQAIRRLLCRQPYDDSVGGRVRIQYGGSVKPSNAAELFGQPDIDGGLIGGASLNADDFLAIIGAAAGS